MTNYRTIEDIKNTLSATYKKAVSIHHDIENKQDKIFSKGYLKGIEEALEMITDFLKKKPANASPNSMVHDVQENNSLKLFNIRPEEILKLDFKNPPHNNYVKDELTEAAFNLENQLLELLGDVNSMPFDSYEMLNSNQLIKIIKNSAEGICRFNKK